MSEEMTERVRGLPEESKSGEKEETLLVAVIVLGVIAFVLILIVIYGYCRFVRGRRRREKEEEETEAGGRERSGNMREAEGGPPPALGGEELPAASQLDVPVKMRKRSMTFTETDEECRKYREDLAESYDSKPEAREGGDRFRKKSVVTFAGVEEIDANGL